MMSFLGSTGHLMSGSGLPELLETVYAPNAVSHMMTETAVARAVRAHMIVDTALHAMLVSKTFGVKLPNDEDGTCSLHGDSSMSESYTVVSGTDPDEPIDLEELDNVTNQQCSGMSSCPVDTLSDSLTTAATLYDKLVSGEIAVDSICENPTMDKLNEEITTEKKSVEHLRTASG